MARRTGVGRAIATYEIPIEGRDEWLAAARRLALGTAQPDAPRTARSGWSPRSSPPGRRRRPPTALGLSDSTVKHHLANARSKVGAETTAQLVWILAPRLPEPDGVAQADE